MSKSKAVCPSCKSNNLTLIELWKDHSVSWEQIDGVFDRQDGALEPGDPYRVEGECSDCGHSWMFRKITQIDGLIIL